MREGSLNSLSFWVREREEKERDDSTAMDGWDRAETSLREILAKVPMYLRTA